MEFRLLGSLSVSDQGRTVALGGPKQRLVLAHMLLRANQVVPADTLIEEIWGDDPPDAARSSLQAYVSRLRKSLGPGRLERRPPGYILHAEPREVDAVRFASLVREAQEHLVRDPARALTLLDEALALCDGPPLADLADDQSLRVEIARLEEMVLSANEDSIDASLTLGRPADVTALERLVDEHPLRERLWGLLMLALYRSGRQADALEAFQRLRSLLADELGIDPSPEIQQLHEGILRQDHELDPEGETLRGYRLLDQIGDGAFGVVHRAIQPQVGREVAVKSIHRELANQPDFVRRFEREAQFVARLEHPHVVPLYDYWREPDGAYLVMRLLRGGSLEDLLRQGALDAGRVAGILDQIADALSAAHRQGVVHRDVKPGNVLLDEEGNAYLSDFGVALDAGAADQTTGVMARGTPAYLSPEQIRLEPATPRSDIYALGVVLFEALTGEHPFTGTSLTALLDQHLRSPMPSVRTSRPELPSGIDAVIARSTDKRPDHRYGDALELAAAFRACIEGTNLRAIPAEEVRNPYKGLRAFLEADAADFFGREVLTRRLVERLAEPRADGRFLCVVGPSGSGKSSVVRAGLVPALRRGAVEGSERWYVVEMMPGPHPFRQLETALLGIAVEPPPSLLEDLEADELGLARAAALVLPDPSAELLIIVDQLEEVFTLVADDAERQLVLDSITAATRQPGGSVRVVATLRADFFDQPLSVRGFGDLLAARTEAITPMSPEDLDRAIRGPAERVGLDLESGLATTMVAEVLDRPGALPLLQYALTELTARGNGTLTLDAYRDIGGTSGALARRAELLFSVLDDEGRRACRELFLRLVALEGTETVRRRVRRSELPGDGRNASIDGVIESFGRHGLLSFDRDPNWREPTVEIAHEALLGAWERLARWIDDARGDIGTRNALDAAAAGWEAAGRDESELYRGARLAAALDWTAEHPLELNDLERDFVAESRAAADREAGRQRRTNRRLRALLVGVALFLVVALAAGTLALVQRSRAQHSATVALSQSLGAKAVAETKLDTSLLLAEEGVQLDDSLETRSNLLTVLLHSPSAIRVLHPGTLGSSPAALAVAPDGRTLAAVNLDGSLRFYDTGTGALIGEPIRGVGASGLKLPLFTPDGSEIAVVRGPGVQLIDVRTHEVAATIAVRGGPDGLWSPVLLSADGSVVYLVVAKLVPFDHRAEVAAFDVSTGRLLRTALVPGLACQGLAIANDTGEIVTLTPAGGGLIEVRDGGTLAVERSFPVPLPVNETYAGCSNYVMGVSEDGRTAAYAVSNVGGDESLRFVDLQTGTVRVANGVAAGGDLVAVSPDGTTAFSATDDYLHLSVWDVASGTLVQTLSGHSGSIESAIFDPTGRTLYSASDDGSVFTWDLSGTRSFGHAFSAGPGSPRAPGLVYTHFSASPDGTSIAVPYGEERLDGSGGGVNIVDLGSGRITTRVQVAGHAPGVDSISYAEFSPRGTELLVSPGPASNGDITLWRLDGGPPRLVRSFSGLTASEGSEDGGFVAAPWATFSPDGRWIAGVDRRENGDGRLIEWNATTGAERTAPLSLRWREEDGPVSQNVVYSPDGSLIATSVAGDRVVIVDAGTLRPVRTIRDPHGVAVVAFSPTKPGLLAEGSADVGIVRLWDVASGRQVAQAEGSNTTFGGMGSLQFDSTGSFLLTEGVVDAAARLWSVPGLQQVGTDLPGVPSRLGTATFAGRGTSTLAVLVYSTGEALSYRVSPVAWERQACAVASRNFTQAEWHRYLPDRPYSKVCPDL